MSDTSGTRFGSGARGGLGTTLILELRGCDIRTRGVNRGGKADVPAGVTVLAVGMSQGCRRAGTRNTASQ